MRNIPGLTSDVLNRATAVAAKAAKARSDATAGIPAPRNTIAPATVANGVATLRLYDYIDPDGGYWGISANEFAQALDEAGDVSKIDLRINSGGGAVWDGLAILNTLRAHGATVTATVDGVAASAASFIAVACDEVVMMPNSRMMIHDALGVCVGQAGDMREYADFLDDTSSNIAEIYAERAGGTTEEWRATMTANGLIGQWYSAQEAVDAGLADRVGGATAKAEPGPKDQTQPEQKPEPVDEFATATAERRERTARRQHAQNTQRFATA